MEGKVKRLLAGILSLAMVLTAPGFTGAFRQEVQAAEVVESISESTLAEEPKAVEEVTEVEEEEIAEETQVSAESAVEERTGGDYAYEDALLAKYSFDNLDSVADGTVVPDESPNANDAAIRGTGAEKLVDSISLPGGASGSGAAYVELPADAMENHDNLTISVWLNNQTGAGDYAAMFLGQKPTGSFPTLYWLLNPSKGGNFKTVLTKTANAAAPYNTETAVSSTKTGDYWQMYTTVISGNTITGYLDGEQVSTDSSSTMTISDFGEDLVSFIGKSSYPDKFYKGGVKDVQIYATPLNGEEVQDLYKTATGEKKTAGVKVSSINVDEISPITVEEGTGRDLSTPAEINFSNGDTKDDGMILWKDSVTGEAVRNTKDLDPGEYQLNGTLSYFGNPIIDEKADPYITYDEETGYYYFTSSWPAYGDVYSGYNRVSIRKSQTLEGLSTASENVIWSAHTNSGEESYHIWAPELHKINGKWYVYFAANSDSEIWSIRPYVLECAAGADLTKSSSWTEKGRFTNADGSYTGNFDGFSLDMTYFADGGKDYVVWAYKAGSSVLKIAEVNKEEPWKLAGDAVTISVPEYAWERVNEKVNEGPAVLIRNGKVYLTYSASATGDEYCVGMLTAASGSNLLDVDSWNKSPQPVLQTSDLAGQYGPGHNSFTVDKNGNVILVYHARDEKCHQNLCAYADKDPLYDPCRNANLAYVRWDENGDPIFTDTEEMESADVTRTGYTMNVTVTEKEAAPIPSAAFSLYEDLQDTSEHAYTGTLTLSENEAYFDNGLVFKGTAGIIGKNYLDLSDNTGLLNEIEGTNDLTITAWVRNDVKGNSKNTVFSFGKDEQNFFAFNTLNWDNGRGSFVVNNIESGFNYGTSGNEKSVTGSWYPIAIVLKEITTGTQIRYYMNDKLLLSMNSTNKISDLGDLSFFHIGGGVNSNYYDFIGGIRNVKVYTGALKQNQIRTINTNVMEETLAMEIQASISDNKVTVSKNMTLPSSIYPDFSVSWNSANKDLLSDSGVVTIPTRDTEVDLTAVIQSDTVDDYSNTYTYHVTVKGIPAAKRLEMDKAALKINNIDDVRGNLELPVKGENGSVITWESSNTNIITHADNGRYKAGMVTRPETDTDVTLTASLTIEDQVTTKVFTAKVKAAIEQPKFEDYMFAYFTGEGSANGEQIYFASSKDGLDWEALNEGSPVISSTLGEEGLRDPFIIRSPEGDKFYLIATDLKIYGNGDWGRSQTAGSQSIMIWESNDLVNWTDQRMVKIALDNAGCTWAPEAYYDDESGEYIVFWASKTSDDNYGTHQIYYSTTRDFYTFSEPQVWISLYNKNGDRISVIDTSVIAVEDADGKKTYYRNSKDEASSNASIDEGDPASGKFTYIEKSDSLTGTWTRIPSSYLSNTQWVEGGTFFKFNDEEKWCLLLDAFGNGGYFPSITENLDSGEFTKLNSSEYSFPSTMRHGTVIGVTKKEYNALLEKWGIPEKEIDSDTSIEDSQIAHFTFDDAETGLSGNGAVATPATSIAYTTDAVSGNALNLKSANKDYLSITQGDGNSLMTGYTSATINYWSKAASSGNQGWTTYISPSTAGPVFNTEHYLGIIDTTSNVKAERYYNSGGRSEAIVANQSSADWKMVTLVVEPKKTKIYIDGELKSTVASKASLKDIAGKNGIFQLGKANWGSGEYYNGYIDELTVYGRALTNAEVLHIAGKPVPVETVTVSADKTALKIGQKLQLTAAVLPELATDKAVEWGVSDNSIATVSTSGEVTAAAAGKTTVTATAKDGSKVFGSIEITVSDYLVESVEIIASKTNLDPGEKTQLSVNVLPADAKNKEVTWQSSDEEVAVVSEEGEVTALTAGVTYVTATSKDGTNISDQIGIVVNYIPIESITITAESTSLDVKQTVSLNAQILPANATLKSLTWTSSNEKVVSVTQDGVIWTWKEGEAEIRAASRDGSDVYGSIMISVKNKAKIDLENCKLTIKGNKESFAYTGTAIVPQLIVYGTDGKTKLKENVDYLVKYTNNYNAGTAKVTITGVGDYTGALSKDFAITAKSISKAVISSIENCIYTGSAVAPQIIVADGSMFLEKDKDFEVQYDVNPVGSQTEDTVVTVSVVGKGNYTDKVKKTAKFTILCPKENLINLSDTSKVKAVFSSTKKYTYNGKVQKPKVVVTDAVTGKKLSSKYYYVTYLNSTNAGTGTVRISGKKGAYGSQSLEFTIAKKDLSKVKIAKPTSIVYDGDNVTGITLRVSDGKMNLTEGIDFTAAYTNLDKISSAKEKATVTLTALENSNYTGNSKTISFSIAKRKLSNKNAVKVTVDKAVLVKNGVAVTPKITVTYNGEALTEGIDYTVKYSGNKKITKKAKVKISAVKTSTIYTGSKTQVFEITAE